jgi:hypothetical protein
LVAYLKGQPFGHRKPGMMIVDLAEKFILLLEIMVKSNGHAHTDGSEGWVSGYSYLLEAR